MCKYVQLLFSSGVRPRRCRFARICDGRGVFRCAAEEDNASSPSASSQDLTTERLSTNEEGWRETIVVSNRCFDPTIYFTDEDVHTNM